MRRWGWLGVGVGVGRLAVEEGLQFFGLCLLGLDGGFILIYEFLVFADLRLIFNVCLLKRNAQILVLFS